MSYVQVMGANASAEVMEVPLDDNNHIPLSTLQSMFEAASGLKYRNEETKAMRVVKLVNDEFHAPEGGWSDRVYLVVSKKDLVSCTPDVSTPHSTSHGSSMEHHSENMGIKRTASDDDYHESKRTRGDCYRCGGSGHIAHMCTSLWDSKNIEGGQDCYLCHGKGHIKSRCPNTIPRGICYKCHQFGHNGRDCKNYTGQQGMGGLSAQSGWGQQGSYGYQGQYSSGSSYSGSSQGAFGMQVCYRCQQPGHRATECPKLKDGVSVDSCFKCGGE
eukprot:Ihof_evm3s341 gene=Ihof_evmTU3s341